MVFGVETTKLENFGIVQNIIFEMSVCVKYIHLTELNQEKCTEKLAILI